MSTHAQTGYGKYLVIWVWLILLLAVGAYGPPLLGLSKPSAVALILSVSLIKALLVALFFMHLKSEKIVPLWVIILFPFFLVGLAVLLVTVGPALV